MTSYAADDDAPAVILAHHGSIVYSSGYLIHGHHKRIKILTDLGVEQYGDIKIVFYHHSGTETLRGLKAQTILPDGSVHTVKKSSIFEEKINDYYTEISISFPRVEPGVILEYKYDLHSKRLAKPETWYFQDVIPTVYSQLQYKFNDDFTYVTLGTAGFNKEDDYLYARDLPGLQDEPYVATLDEHRSHIAFQLSRYKDQNGVLKNYLSDWGKLAEELNESITFGAQYNRPSFSAKGWNDIKYEVEALTDDRAKAELIYNHVNNRVKFSGITSLGSTDGVNKAYTQGSGTSGDINLLLLALLKRANIDASPVLVGFRSEGQALRIYPMIDQFSHTLVEASIDGEIIYLDGGDKNRPVGMIRVGALNRDGWRIGEGMQNNWIVIQAPVSKNTFVYTLSASSDGSLVGDFQHRAEGYAAYYERDSDDEGLDWWADEFAQFCEEAVVSEYDAENEDDPNLPFKESMAVDLLGASRDAGDKLYLSAFPYKTFEKGFFSLDDRSFPVDMPYPFSEKHVTTLTIPEGYKVESIPESAKLMLPEGAGKLSFMAVNRDQTVQIICSFSVNKTYYTPEEYGGLKYFFDLYIDKLDEQIVLSKI